VIGAGLLAAALLTGPRAETSSTPTAAFAPDGRLWVVFVEESAVYVSSSTDEGRTFAPAVKINPEPERADANGEARPKIAIGGKGEIFVSYTRKLAKPYTGDIRFARSTDGGRTFRPPITVNDDGLATGHRFDALTVSPKGHVHLFWIDKRDIERLPDGAPAYEGAALYSAVSTNGGRTFSKNRKLKDHVCECCRLAVGWDGGTPLVLWRDLMEGGVRDHALARVEGGRPPKVVRATDDGWAIDGCPHHGPALATSGRIVHLAWFTGEGRRGRGTFYRRSTDGGRTFADPIPVGGDATVGRPQLLAMGSTVWLAWKDAIPEGEGSVVRAMSSSDSGLTWSEPREVARSGAAADHPQLLARGSDAFLSWFAKDAGYRLVPLAR
jgi:hypothetical protein